ncbi:MAG: hypothetical protein U9N11_05140, partial [Campylobacterota bacterium]|nr:hypothetical protein [Campylobacterota bacterium]
SIGLSPMQPDSFHFHMLVHRQITKNNPLTALFIVLFILPFSIVSTLHANNSFYNIKIAIAFIVSYVLLYVYLRHKENTFKS